MRQLLTAALGCCLVAGAYAQSDLPFETELVTSFDLPWAPAFLPDGRMLVTEKKGSLPIVTREGQKSRPVRWLPDVDYGGQGGFGDIAVHPEFADNSLIYMSYMVYRGSLLADWRGDALAAGLSSRAVIRIEIDGGEARQVERFPMGARIRGIAEGPDGAIWVLEDERRESGGRLLKLTPKRHPGM